MRLAPTLLAAALALGLAACDRDRGEPTEPVGPTADASRDTSPDTLPADDAAGPAGGTMLAASAIATLQPAAGSTVSGTLNFAVDDGGVRMTGGLTGLAPDSTHAMHLHAVGDCSAPDFSSAGDHFNPDGQPHGDRAGTGPHHAGDMPNQVADPAGNAKVDQRLEGLTIDGGGPTDIVGKAVVVHADPDDYTTQPSGNAGARVACGVIELENPAPEYRGPADAGMAPAETPEMTAGRLEAERRGAMSPSGEDDAIAADEEQDADTAATDDGDGY